MRSGRAAAATKHGPADAKAVNAYLRNKLPELLPDLLVTECQFEAQSSDSTEDTQLYDADTTDGPLGIVLTLAVLNCL